MLTRCRKKGLNDEEMHKNSMADEALQHRTETKSIFPRTSHLTERQRYRIAKKNMKRLELRRRLLNKQQKLKDRLLKDLNTGYPKNKKI